jgi:hypothetical protein
LEAELPSFAEANARHEKRQCQLPRQLIWPFILRHPIP